MTPALQAQMKASPEPNHYDEERLEFKEQEAKRMLEVELKRRGWTERELLTRPKSDKDKVAIEVRIRRKTTMTLKSIAARMVIGSWTNLIQPPRRRPSHQTMTNTRHTVQSENRALEELKRRGWTERELRNRRKSDKGNVAMEVRIRRERTMTLKWIAARMERGSWTNVSNLLPASRRTKR